LLLGGGKWLDDLRIELLRERRRSENNWRRLRCKADRDRNRRDGFDDDASTHRVNL
jgi:hypothetical protein